MKAIKRQIEKIRINIINIKVKDIGVKRR